MATVRRIVRVPEESSESSGREPAAKLSRKLAATRPQTTRLSRAAGMMTQSLAFARTYEALRDGCGQPKLAANWLMGEVSKRLNAEGREMTELPLAVPVLAKLIGRVVDGTVSNNGARQVFDVIRRVVVADVLQRCGDGFNQVVLADRGHGGLFVSGLGQK